MCRIRSRPQSPTSDSKKDDDSASSVDDENVAQRVSKRSRYSLLVLGFAGPVLLFGGHRRRNPSLPPVVSKPTKKGLRGGPPAASSLAAQNPWEKDHLSRGLDEMDKSRDTDAYLPSQLAELLVGTDGVPKQGPHFTPEDKARLIKKKMQDDEEAAIRRHRAALEKKQAAAKAKTKTRGMLSTAGGTTAAADAAPSTPEVAKIEFRPKENTNTNTKGGKTAGADAPASPSKPTNQQGEGRRVAANRPNRFKNSGAKIQTTSGGGYRATYHQERSLDARLDEML